MATKIMDMLISKPGFNIVLYSFHGIYDDFMDENEIYDDI
jgi:hypothetical protein